MLRLPIPHSVVRFLAAAILALAVVFGLLYLGLILFSNSSKQASGGVPSADQEKLNVLASLKSPDAVPATQKAEMLQALGLGAGGSIDDAQKLNVLHSLSAQ